SAPSFHRVDRDFWRSREGLHRFGDQRGHRRPCRRRRQEVSRLETKPSIKGARRNKRWRGHWRRQERHAIKALGRRPNTVRSADYGAAGDNRAAEVKPRVLL